MKQQRLRSTESETETLVETGGEGKAAELRGTAPIEQDKLVIKSIKKAQEKKRRNEKKRMQRRGATGKTQTQMGDAGNPLLCQNITEQREVSNENTERQERPEEAMSNTEQMEGNEAQSAVENAQMQMGDAGNLLPSQNTTEQSGVSNENIERQGMPGEAMSNTEQIGRDEAQSAVEIAQMQMGDAGNLLPSQNTIEQSGVSNENIERQGVPGEAMSYIEQMGRDEAQSAAENGQRQEREMTSGTSSNINNERRDIQFTTGRRIQRKRSRTVERDGNGENKQMSQQNKVDKYGVGKTMKMLQEIVFKLGKAGCELINTKEMDDVFSTLTIQILEMTTVMLNMQEEKNALMEQILALQQNAAKSAVGNVIIPSGTATYLQTAQKGLAKAVAAGTCLPPPVLPEITKHVPAEKVILYKAGINGEMPTRVQQEEFRGQLKLIIGSNGMSEVSAIRPTRAGGYTIIFRSEEGRDLAMEKITVYQEQVPENERKQRIIAPKKKVAKIVCREPPFGYSHSQILEDFYGKHNPILMKVNALERQAKIFETRLGWVFELSASEAAAVEGQGNRIRYGCGNEMRVEEFIPLQQCYRCCLFGHSAKECTAIHEHCRLCGKQGHSGKDCIQKDNKEAWRCANCTWNNMNKGTSLPVDHAAAQLHKCAIAQNEKAIRKSQLATAGVFTAPLKPFIPKGTGELRPSTTPVNENKDVRKTASSSTSSTVKGQGGRRRTPSLHLARCFVPPTTTTSSASTTKHIPKKGNETVHIRPTAPPTMKFSQSQGGRGGGWNIVGRGRGREASDRRGGTNSGDTVSQSETFFPEGVAQERYIRDEMEEVNMNK